jgi:hypothetical protein
MKEDAVRARENEGTAGGRFASGICPGGADDSIGYPITIDVASARD